MDYLNEFCRMLMRSGPEAEIQQGRRYTRESFKTYNLSESGRMLVHGGPEAEIQFERRSAGKSAATGSLTESGLMLATVALRFESSPRGAQPGNHRHQTLWGNCQHARESRPRDQDPAAGLQPRNSQKQTI
jgi:hypothetical protein